jgi:tetratricopeptide (TPR) repeat protein
MPGVFLSYRRPETDYAVLLYAWLAERFGPPHVFWDREDIDPGKDFRRVLSERLRESEALVALIGPAWTPSPWIQKEIRAALRRKILVLPVLVGETPNLQPNALPKSIRPLAVLQTLETRDLRFRDLLVTELERVVTRSSAEDSIDSVRVQRLTNLLRNQSDHRQSEALELIIDGKIDQASDVLNETFELLMTLLEFNPADPDIEVRLGFLYKDLAQVFRATDPVRFRRHVQSGLQLFEGLVRRKLSGYVAASAWNGLGNMHLLTGDYQHAIEYCSRATRLSPTYAHAWADLFHAYVGHAEAGTVDLAAMRRTLARLKATAKGVALLERRVPDYEATLDGLEKRYRRRLSPDKGALPRHQSP